MGWKETLRSQVDAVKGVSVEAGTASTADKNRFLRILAAKLRERSAAVAAANRRDVARAAARGLPAAFIDRLSLGPERIEKTARAVEAVEALPDPVGTVIRETVRPDGLDIRRVRVPIGVIAIIYESRPDVTVEAGVLCIKAGNCVVLRGGRDALRSNLALAGLMRESLAEAGLPPDMAALVTAGGRRGVRAMLSFSDAIDLVIPRGGESLIRTVVEHSRIPVIKHYKGICHTYVDADADIETALAVTYNAKVQRPATCNATEVLLVHRDIAGRFLPRMAAMFRSAGVEMRGCPATRAIVPDAVAASAADWDTEFLALIIAVRIVDSLDEAIAHVNRHGSKHSDAIITRRAEAAARFFAAVDSACLYQNASTRFTDGGEFGLGAEIGISTDKFHARGPMGLEELTTYKYLVRGNGHTRS